MALRYNVRRLRPDELPKVWELGRRAFGGARTPPDAWTVEWRSQHAWGIVDTAGRLVAQALDREQQHWFGGSLVPASGVAGVVVAPEVRGTGLARIVLTELLAAARERGAAISTLFPTTATPYRRLGWEEVGVVTWLTLPTLALAGVDRPEDTELHEAVAADFPHLLDVYRAVARTGNGWLERDGPLFATEPDAVLGAHDGITVARSPEETLAGYAAWDRAGAGELSVPELIGLTPSATSALLSMLSRWASVASTIRFRLPDRDPLLLAVDAANARVVSRQPWMLRVVDARAAVAARGWPRHTEGSLGIILDDDVCPWNSGEYQLILAGGSARLEPGGPSQVRLTMRGLALLYAGGMHPSVLRRAGLLSGGDAKADGFLEAATAGPSPTILDTF